MISYTPLFKTLEDKGIVISSLRDHGIHPSTVASINSNKSVKLEKIEKICKVLQVPIEKVVEIKFEDTE